MPVFAYNVYRKNGSELVLIDTVYFTEGFTIDEVKRSLIIEDDFPSDIIVERDGNVEDA